jgi:hypothetical protein
MLLEERIDLDLDAQQRILRFALCRMLLGERIALELDAQQRILRFALCRMLLVAEHPGAFPGKSASLLISMRSSASYGLLFVGCCSSRSTLVLFQGRAHRS